MHCKEAVYADSHVDLWIIFETGNPSQRMCCTPRRHAAMSWPLSVLVLRGSPRTWTHTILVWFLLSQRGITVILAFWFYDRRPLLSSSLVLFYHRQPVLSFSLWFFHRRPLLSFYWFYSITDIRYYNSHLFYSITDNHYCHSQATQLFIYSWSFLGQWVAFICCFVNKPNLQISRLVDQAKKVVSRTHATCLSLSWLCENRHYTPCGLLVSWNWVHHSVFVVSPDHHLCWWRLALPALIAQCNRADR